MMNEFNQPEHDRRQWFVGAARLLAFGGLSATAAGLLTRRPSRDCRLPLTCCDCARFDECTLPKRGRRE